METAEHLEGLRQAMLAFVRYADRAGWSAPVPTTPDWTVRRLVEHQGTVHRWAAALVRGEVADEAAYERAGRSAVDPAEWLREGALEVAGAIARAPEDLVAPVFLADAPPPRAFWARRQCHETTVHAVDAMSASLGRAPRAAETWIGRELALDGIDELLTGFVPRERSRLRSEDPVRVLVRPDDGDRSWLVRIGPGLPVVRRDPLDPGEADVVLTGDPVALYLTLWNRGDEAAPDADWDLWVTGSRISWA